LKIRCPRDQRQISYRCELIRLVLTSFFLYPPCWRGLANPARIYFYHSLPGWLKFFQDSFKLNSKPSTFSNWDLALHQPLLSRAYPSFPVFRAIPGGGLVYAATWQSWPTLDGNSPLASPSPIRARAALAAYIWSFLSHEYRQSSSGNCLPNFRMPNSENYLRHNIGEWIFPFDLPTTILSLCWRSSELHTTLTTGEYIDRSFLPSAFSAEAFENITLAIIDSHPLSLLCSSPNWFHVTLYHLIWFSSFCCPQFCFPNPQLVSQKPLPFVLIDTIICLVASSGLGFMVHTWNLTSILIFNAISVMLRCYFPRMS